MLVKTECKCCGTVFEGYVGCLRFCGDRCERIDRQRYQESRIIPRPVRQILGERTVYGRNRVTVVGATHLKTGL